MAAGDLTLEIVEGPGAGQQIPLDRPIVIGRGSDSDLVLEDGQASRHHARITPQNDSSAIVEDLESANGTFLNQNELVGAAVLDTGDQLLIGVTMLQLRSRQEVLARPSAVITIPPALARAAAPATYVNPDVVKADEGSPPPPTSQPSLERYLDTKVRRRAQLAPLALFTLVAIALILYFALR